MNQPTSIEVERLIEKNLAKVWAGDKEAVGIFRIIEILRWAAREAESQEPNDARFVRVVFEQSGHPWDK